MSLALAPVGNHSAGVSMAPIVFDIKAGLEEALGHIASAVASPKPKRTARKAKATDA